MIAKYSRWGFAVGVPGLVLQIAGCFISQQQYVLGGVCMVFGTALLSIGLSYYALAKGRSPAWGCMTFLSVIGMIVLAVLRDRSGPAPEVGERHEQT